jgi:PAS domain-containing protein
MYAEILPLTQAIKYKNEEIKRQTENAQEREIQLQVITDTMNEGFLLLDKNGHIQHINDFALKLFGSNRDIVKKQHYT